MSGDNVKLEVVCPISMMAGFTHINCLGEKCGWNYDGECAIRAIAKYLETKEGYGWE